MPPGEAGFENTPMTAYVVKAPPVHENSLNYFAAELGFYRLGYYVERFDLAEVGDLEVTEETPVFGGVETMAAVLPGYIGLPYYPPELGDYLLRPVEQRPIEEVERGEFFKPLEHQHKLFSPHVKDDSLSGVNESEGQSGASSIKTITCTSSVMRILGRHEPLARP